MALLAVVAHLALVVAFEGAQRVFDDKHTGNQATEGGGIFIRDPDTVVTLKNTIVANNPRGGNCSGTITDGGGNLSFPDTTCPGSNADPLLGS